MTDDEERSSDASLTMPHLASGSDSGDDVPAKQQEQSPESSDESSDDSNPVSMLLVHQAMANQMMAHFFHSPCPCGKGVRMSYLDRGQLLIKAVKDCQADAECVAALMRLYVNPPCGAVNPPCVHLAPPCSTFSAARPCAMVLHYGEQCDAEDNGDQDESGDQDGGNQGDAEDNGDSAVAETEAFLTWVDSGLDVIDTKTGWTTRLDDMD